MKRIRIFYLSILLISCKDNNNKSIPDKANQIIESKVVQQQDSSNWVQSFIDFRTAIYQGDKSKVKSFIDFPIMDDNNEIWYLVYGGNEKALNLLSKKTKPFTSLDFDKYFENLFPKTFIKGILKVKIEEVSSKGEYETIELKDTNSTTYRAYATFSEKERTLTLNLAYNTPVKAIDGNGQKILDPGEYSVIYVFNILKNGKIEFNRIRMVG